MKSDSLKALEAAALHLSHGQGWDDQQSVQMSASSLPSLVFLHLDYLKAGRKKPVPGVQRACGKSQ